VSDTVLVSTHDLRRAGALRIAFRSQGYDVDLVTPQEQLDPTSDAALLVLSSEAGSDPSEGLVAQAARRGIPIMGYPPLGVERVVAAALAEVFAARVSPDEAAVLGRRLIERRRLQRLTGIVGESEPIREVMERVVQIAPVDSTVLVTGESGTGKELVARGVHALSPRRHKAFIAVNVAALPDTLLESELFGHEKGAFTGAVDSRRGLFELAHGGTIFLDEIGDMPLSTQTKLLRVLEQREFLRVGGEKPIRVDVRIIAATNQELRQLVVLNEFRRDLYYRLNVLSIVLPPLRERAEDVPLLVEAFVKAVSEHHDRTFMGISAEAMQILQAHSWPGNIRELRNLVESMVVLSPGRTIEASDIPPEVRGIERGRALVLAPPPRGDKQALRPELEFIFRTLVELRVDMDQLRREFETYRGGMVGPGAITGLERRLPPWRIEADDAESIDYPAAAEVVPDGDHASVGNGEGEPEKAEAKEGDGVVVYRSGMTMEDLEREAIRAALTEARGNRRRAAERLDIGERTLYRKIQRFGLDV